MGKNAADFESDPLQGAESRGEQELDPAHSLVARLRSVAEAGHLLLDTESQLSAYGPVVDMACDRMGADIGLLFVYEPEDRLLHLAASRGLEDLPGGPPPKVGLGQGLSGWTALHRSAVVVGDVREDGRFGSTSFLHYKRLSAVSVPIAHGDTLLGVLTLCNERPGAFGAADLLACEALAVSLAFGLRVKHLREEARTHYLSIIQGLVNALEAKDPVTQGHSMRIAHLCREMARHMGFKRALRDRIEIAARLHDIGKIGIPDHILGKPGPLTEAEQAAVRRHPAIGAEILRGIPALEEISRIVEAHHERLDGRGYPHCLAGADIPLESRIIAVADAFDAMVMRRPYRHTLDCGEALREIETCAGTQFDPVVVRALDAVIGIKRFEHFYGG